LRTALKGIESMVASDAEALVVRDEKGYSIGKAGT